MATKKTISNFRRKTNIFFIIISQTIKHSPLEYKLSRYLKVYLHGATFGFAFAKSCIEAVRLRIHKLSFSLTLVFQIAVGCAHRMPGISPYTCNVG